jgi:chromosome segregation ATPase
VSRGEERRLAGPPPGTPIVAAEMTPLPDTLSTSARLTKAEQERDEALAKRDQAIENGSYWNREFDRARAELASARQELEQLLVEHGQARDALDREKSRRSGCPNPITEGAPTMTTTNPGGEGGS